MLFERAHFSRHHRKRVKRKIAIARSHRLAPPDIGSVISKEPPLVELHIFVLAEALQYYLHDRIALSQGI